EILIEIPDAEAPKKPSQLYAKVRELAPGSPVAFQFASVFDIQTGELLVPATQAPAAEPSLQVEPLQPQGEISATTEEARVSDVMPWEQFDGTPPIQETPLPTSSNPVLESLDVPDIVIEPAPVGLAPQELETPPSESTGPNQGANDDEGVTPTSFEERTVDVERVMTPSAGSPGLSSPMPWEQRENSTVKIEETASSTAPLAQLDETPLLDDQSVLTQPANTQPEFVSGQLSSSVPVPDLTEPGESIFAAEP